MNVPLLMQSSVNCYCKIIILLPTMIIYMYAIGWPAVFFEPLATIFYSWASTSLSLSLSLSLSTPHLFPYFSSSVLVSDWKLKVHVDKCNSLESSPPPPRMFLSPLSFITLRACAKGKAIGLSVCYCRHENRQILSFRRLCVL